MNKLVMASILTVSLISACGSYDPLRSQEIVPLTVEQIQQTKNKTANISLFGGLPLTELYGMKKNRESGPEIIACGRYGSGHYFAYDLADDDLLYIPDGATGQLANDWRGQLSSSCSKTGTTFTPAPVNEGANINQA